MENTDKRDWDSVIRVMMKMVLIMVGALILSSGLKMIFPSGAMSIIQFYVGIATIILSGLVIVLQLVLTRHPHYDIWLVCERKDLLSNTDASV